jgi:hypothetical protein
MVNFSPCSKSSATPRRRAAKWPKYHNDNAEPQVRNPMLPAWPAVPPQVAPTADASASTPSGGKLSSQAQLAERLYVSVATLARARKEGLLVGHLIGSQWRFSEQQIADYLKIEDEPLRLYGKRLNDNDPS